MRIASFPVVRKEDLYELRVSVVEHAQEESRQAIQKQEDARLILLLDAAIEGWAANNPKAKIGLPEIMVGIFPGAGGTTRLVRKMGAMMAAPFLLEGKLSDPKEAKLAGLIDEVVAPDQLLARAKEWLLSAKDADLVKPWDAKGYKMPGGEPFHPAGFMTFVGASAMVNGTSRIRASVWASSVLPEPVGPISMMLDLASSTSLCFVAWASRL